MEAGPGAQAGASAAPAVMERFRSMMREREEDLREADDDEEEKRPVAQLSAAEAVIMYEEVLSELTFNSKPVITELTIIAGEHRHAASGIADAICNRIIEVPEDQKLPALYLLDSIVKNIGREYVRHFAVRLLEVFCEAYYQLHPSIHPSMRHLFGTWTHVFPRSVLQRIEEELQFCSPRGHHMTNSSNTRHSESLSPQQSHGIHVNPKYLEAGHQSEHSPLVRDMHSREKNENAVDFGGGSLEGKLSESPLRWSGAPSKSHDFQHTGVPSTFQLRGWKPSVGYDDYDVDKRLGLARGDSPHLSVGNVSSSLCDQGRQLHSDVNVVTSLSPPTIRSTRSSSPTGDKVQSIVSPARRVVEKPSPSRSVMEFGSSQITGRSHWSARSWPLSDGPQQHKDASFYNFNKQRTKELIDTYGNYKEDTPYYGKHQGVQRLDVNVFRKETVKRKWTSSEEEEYEWEDMSPTLAERGRGTGSLFGLGSSAVSTRDTFGRPHTAFLGTGVPRYNGPTHFQLPVVDEAAITVEDRIPAIPLDHEIASKKYPDDIGRHNNSLLPFPTSRYDQEPLILPHHPPSSHPNGSLHSQGRVFHPSFSDSRVPASFGVRSHDPLNGGFTRSRIPGIKSDALDRATIEKFFVPRPCSPPPLPGIRPPVHKSQVPPLHPIYPMQRQIESSYNLVEVNKPLHQEIRSSYPPQLQFDVLDGGPSNSRTPQVPYPQPMLTYLNQRNMGDDTAVGIHSRVVRGNSVSSAPAQLSSHIGQPLNPVQTQEHGAIMISSLPNSSSVSAYNSSCDFLQGHGGPRRSLPTGPPTLLPHTGPSPQNAGSLVSNPPTSAFSGLINSLMEKGLISLTPSAPSQDTLGTEFNIDVLKVRHEAAVTSLYADLPRQCTTCGLRFRFQEEHSNHMDWHVTKNRISKNRKQNPSRKWFVNTKEWLCGAETLGTEVVPGFMPPESIIEKKEDQELAVLADESQNVCALCGESFEDFYSDETEEWMYKGAVYLNAPDGYIEGLDRSQLGPIVHAVCRSESNKGPGDT